ncbi:MAG: IclR family transcriptional regulator [Micropruina sp.]|uniref:IclR family transcriptional regulator n=1 Tax=Micropruina sp. TaxID=2737536 RepID=UPI0039E5E80E
MTDGPRIEAIDRALALLTALAEAGPDGATLAGLASVTGVNKSTAYRALSTMRARAFVAQSEATGDYRLGSAAMTLGERFLTPQSLAQSLHPALVTLSRAVDELVHLGVLVGDEVLYVDKVEPERAIRVFSEIGRRTSAATSAMGRALLAARGVPDDQLAAYLHQRALTVEQLAAVLNAARARGFSTELEENEPGVACLGAALMRGPDAVAALSITMPAERLTEQRQGELAELIGSLLPPLLPEGLSLWTP